MTKGKVTSAKDQKKGETNKTCNGVAGKDNTTCRVTEIIVSNKAEQKSKNHLSNKAKQKSKTHRGGSQ